MTALNGPAPIAGNTRRAYEAALRGFDGSECPETDAGVAAYITGLYEGGRSVACAAMVVAALRFRARRHGRPSPVGAAASRVLAEFRRLSDRSVRRIITRWGSAAGAEGRVSGHSLRAGGAQSLASAGASLAEMQAAGRRRSPAMPGRYAQGQPAEQEAVKRLRYGR